MKKVVILLLIVLPFVLIYFISITGRILEKYSHIYVENVLVSEEKEVMKEGQVIKEYHQLEDGNMIEIDKGKLKTFKIEVAPESASNQTIDIKNFNKEICQYDYDEKTGIIIITGLKYGTATLEFASKEDSKIKFTLKIKVNDAIPTGFTVSTKSITIRPNVTEQLSSLVSIEWTPNTVKEEYKKYTCKSSNENIFTIDEYNNIKAGSQEGVAELIIESIFDPNMKQVITINVTNSKAHLDVHFIEHDKSVYTINEPTIDLNTLVEFSESFKDKYPEEERYKQFYFAKSSGKLESSIVTLKPGEYLEVYIYIGNEQIDKITIRYKN